MTPYQYLKIDIANRFGKDKLIWDERLSWFNDNRNDLDPLEAEDVYGAIASLDALTEVEQGLPTGRLIETDATASFLQVLAVMSGCVDTAFQCNLTNSGKRQDFYSNLLVEMNKNLDDSIHVDRNDIKKAAMPKFYGSSAMPIEVFGKDTPELIAFENALNKLVPGAIEVMGILRSCWDNQALVHSFTLPDGHVAYIPVKEIVKKRIEIDELDHTKFTYQTSVNMPSDKGISILANVVQAFDAYLAREVIRRCSNERIEVLTIHDAYLTHPNNMETLRNHYKETLIELSKEPILENVYNELKGTKDTYEKKTNDLYLKIEGAEYYLS